MKLLRSSLEITGALLLVVFAIGALCTDWEVRFDADLERTLGLGVPTKPVWYDPAVIAGGAVP